MKIQTYRRISLITLTAFLFQSVLPLYASAEAQTEYMRSVSPEHRTLYDRVAQVVQKRFDHLSPLKQQKVLNKMLRMVKKARKKTIRMSDQQVQRRLAILKKPILKAEASLSPHDAIRTEDENDIQEVRQTLLPEVESITQSSLSAEERSIAFNKEKVLSLFDGAEFQIQKLLQSRYGHHHFKTNRKPAQQLGDPSAGAILVLFIIGIAFLAFLLAGPAGIVSGIILICLGTTVWGIVLLVAGVGVSILFYKTMMEE